MKFLPNIKSTIIGLAALTMAPGIASADQFSLMDRVESGSGVETTLGAIIVEDANGTVLKNDYHFQVGLDELGIYAFLPTTHILGDNGSNTAIGNLEAGIVGKTEFSGFNLNYRFGVSVPTAGNEFEDLVTNAIGALADPSNITGGMGDVLGIRTSISPELELGPVFVRADIGTDVLIGMQDSADTAELILRVNAAAGIDVGGLKLSAELVNAFMLTESGSDPLSAMGVTAAFDMDTVTVFGGLSIPLSSGLAEVNGQPIVVNTGVRLSF